MQSELEYDYCNKNNGNILKKIIFLHDGGLHIHEIGRGFDISYITCIEAFENDYGVKLSDIPTSDITSVTTNAEIQPIDNSYMDTRRIAKQEFDKLHEASKGTISWHWWKRAFDAAANIFYNKKDMEKAFLEGKKNENAYTSASDWLKKYDIENKQQ